MSGPGPDLVSQDGMKADGGDTLNKIPACSWRQSGQGSVYACGLLHAAWHIPADKGPRTKELPGKTRKQIKSRSFLCLCGDLFPDTQQCGGERSPDPDTVGAETGNSIDTGGYRGSDSQNLRSVFPCVSMGKSAAFTLHDGEGWT